MTPTPIPKHKIARRFRERLETNAVLSGAVRKIVCEDLMSVLNEMEAEE